MKRTCLLIPILLFFINYSAAQKNDLGSWNIFHLKYTLDDRWSVFGETQLRSLKFYNNFHYYEYVGGVNYKLHNSATISLAAGSFQTYKEGGDFVLPKNNDEIRIRSQIIISQALGKLKIDHRYRAEFRFSNNASRNRLRYRLGLSYPFGKERNNYKPYQISASNELFFTDKGPYFERNRALLTFNFKPSKSTTLQIGYLHQFDYKILHETARDILQIACIIELFRK